MKFRNNKYKDVGNMKDKGKGNDVSDFDKSAKKLDDLEYELDFGKGSTKK